MKEITIDGRIGRSAEVFEGKTGVKYARFSLANSEYRNKEVTTTWFDITTTNEFIVEKLAPYLTKGKYVIISGDLETRDLVTVKNGKVYVNLRVKATSIHFPPVNNQNKEEKGDEKKIEEFTPTAGLTPENDQVAAPVAEPAYAASSVSIESGDMPEDLPF